jgi:glycosyltransferase involved in cell wall biosynthesis
MKVLLVSQIAVVDYKYTFSLANELKRQGNDVELVIDDKDASKECICKVYNKFLTSRKDVGKLNKVINYCSSLKFIVEKAIIDNFDVVHVQWFQLSPVDYYYLKKLKKEGIKLIITVHDILPFNEKFYDKYFHNKLYGFGDHIIVQAENNLKRFTTLFPMYTQKLSFVPHGHFLDYVDIHDKTEARNRLGVPEDKTILLFFGQIKKVKGVGVLLEAFAEVLKKRDDVFLILAGNVWKDNFSYYQQIIDKYNIANELKIDIRFIPDEEVGYYYSACDIAVLPYLDVYQSGVIQLAYAYGKPTIATSIGSFKEIVTDGKTGFLCKPNDSASLANVIENALGHKDKFEVMGLNGREFIKQKYSWTDIARQITQIYESNK